LKVGNAPQQHLVGRYWRSFKIARPPY
jgi:hypothetical protein